MKFRKLAAVIPLLAIIAVSCVRSAIHKEILDFKITPQNGIKPGTIVTAELKTQTQATKVFVYLNLMSSVKVPLKYNKVTRIWTSKYMVPYGATVPRGDFVVKAEVIMKNGKTFTDETTVSTY